MFHAPLCQGNHPGGVCDAEARLRQFRRLGRVSERIKCDGKRPGGRADPAGIAQGARSCEEINNLTQRRQGAKTRKERLLCFLCAFDDFAPLREMLLLIQGLFHSFASLGSRRPFGSREPQRGERVRFRRGNSPWFCRPFRGLTGAWAWVPRACALGLEFLHFLSGCVLSALRAVGCVLS
jgi:hypothetical protein